MGRKTDWEKRDPRDFTDRRKRFDIRMDPAHCRTFDDYQCANEMTTPEAARALLKMALDTMPPEERARLANLASQRRANNQY